jgi:Protein of unknown function (DUF2769)
LEDKMSTDENAKVPDTVANIMKCMCSKCPVQTDSACVKEKLDNLMKKLESVREGDVPEPKDVPGVYCSTGKATCQDLNSKKQCICNTCSVWKEYNLRNFDPSMYFCQKGKAA